jgi:hypothetical protein
VVGAVVTELTASAPAGVAASTALHGDAFSMIASSAILQARRRPMPTPSPAPTPTPSGDPRTQATLHYTANGVFSGNAYSPGAYGFTLADVSSAWYASHLPAGTEALVYVGTCSGADSSFVSTVTRFVGNPSVFGYYLYDEPDPTGKWKTQCTAANLKAESGWIHANDPGRKTFITMMNMGAADNPTFANTYKPANTGIDLYGIAPYPCRTELNGCDYSYITKAFTAAEAWGIPQADLVPVFQTFGGGSWTDDGGGAYQLPTDVQEQQILATWASVLPHPAFDYAYSWGSQNNDASLAGSPSLLQVMKTHNQAG